MEKIKKILLFIGIVLLGTVGVIVSAFLCAYILNLLGIEEFVLSKIAMTWIAMSIGFCIIPIYILKRYYLITRFDVGMGNASQDEKRICIFILCVAILYVCIGRNVLNVKILLIAILQNFVVAFCEEFFSKGILYYVIGKVTNRKIFKVLICSFVFAFIFHNNGAFATNMLYRFPMAVILGICYLKTNNVYLSVTLHLANNLMATSILN